MAPIQRLVDPQGTHHARAVLAALALATITAAQSPYCRQTLTEPGAFIAPSAIAQGDLDGVLGTDLATCTTLGPGVTVALNTGTAGLFAPMVVTPIAPGGRPVHLEIADLDGAANLDVAVVSAGSDTLVISLSATWPAFAPPIVLALPPANVPVEVRAIDFDGDGDQDLAVLTNALPNDNIVIYQNAPLGTFAWAATIPLSAGTHTALRASNVDNAGRIDLAAAGSNGPGYVDVVVNATPSLGLPTFLPAVAVPTPAVPRDLVCIDLDNDGYTDIATSNGAANSVTVLLRTPLTLTFTAATYPLTGLGNALAIDQGRLNCDGWVDLAITNRLAYVVDTLLNNGDGTFTLQPLQPVCPKPADLVTGDFDDNGLSDIATPDLPNYVTSLVNWRPITHCCHTFLGGIVDNHVNPLPFTIEDACPRTELKNWMAGIYTTTRRDFDDGGGDRPFGHTFPKLPGDIVQARLTIGLKATWQPSDNDGLSLGFDAANLRFAWGAEIGSVVGPAVWATGTATATLDLRALPGGVDLLAKMSADRFLDVFVQDDTSVDFIRLDLVTCAPSNCKLDLEVGPLAAGTVAAFDVSNAPPFAPVYYAFSVIGVGPGPFTHWGSFCIVNPFTFVPAVADSIGHAQINAFVPNVALFPPCATLTVQAVAFDFANPNDPLCFSNTWTAQLFN